MEMEAKFEQTRVIESYFEEAKEAYFFSWNFTKDNSFKHK